MRVNIRNGVAQFIYSDEMAGLLAMGPATVRRVSHVEPADNGKGWFADMGPVLGPKLGPFVLRQDALDAELAWLREHKGL